MIVISNKEKQDDTYTLTNQQVQQITTSTHPLQTIQKNSPLTIVCASNTKIKTQL
jgi:hypothetical protein